MKQALLAGLPALQIVLPLLAAPVCFLLRKHGMAWLVAFAVSLVAFAVSIALFAQTSEGGILSYAMGGWPPPWGIEYRIDRFNAFILLLVSGMVAVALAFARQSV